MDDTPLLDADTPDTLRMSAAEATELGVSALKRVGYSDEDARIVVDQLVDNMLCGYRFAGLPRILAIAGDAQTRKARKPIGIVHETPLSALIDGGNNVAYIVAYRAAEVAIDKARKHGMASVGAFNSYYSGRNAYFVERVVNAGLVCLHIASARPRALPRRQGVTEIRIPSERAFRERDRRRREGIVLERKVVESLKTL
jgi:LDH2 family malate/lactate/ureidoglycolate dehydrogenase